MAYWSPAIINSYRESLLRAKVYNIERTKLQLWREIARGGLVKQKTGTITATQGESVSMFLCFHKGAAWGWLYSGFRRLHP